MADANEGGGDSSRGELAAGNVYGTGIYARMSADAKAARERAAEVRGDTVRRMCLEIPTLSSPSFDN